MATTTLRTSPSAMSPRGDFAKGKLEPIDELCVDGYVDHDPMLGDGGRDSVKDTVAGYREAFPDLTFTVEDAWRRRQSRRALERRGHVRERVHGPAADWQEGRSRRWDRDRPLRGRQGC